MHDVQQVFLGLAVQVAHRRLGYAINAMQDINLHQDHARHVLLALSTRPLEMPTVVSHVCEIDATSWH